MSDLRCPCCGQSTEGPAHGFTRIVLTAAGSSFSGGISAGLETPRLLGNGNVIWPNEWSAEQRRVWRMMMDLPGVEWREEEGR